MITVRERMSGVDTAWLRMDQPANLMMIVGAMQFEGRIAATQVRRIVAKRLLRYPRFRDRVVQEGPIAYWERVAQPVMTHHVKSVSLGAKGDEAALADLVSKLASTPLDRERPLWQFHVVNGVGRGSALIIRIHHCYADGIALIQVMLSLTGATAAESLVELPPRTEPDADEGAAPHLLGAWAAPFAQWSLMFADVLRGAQSLVEHGGSLLAHPQQGLHDASALAVALSGRVFDVGKEVAHLATMGPDGDSCLKGSLNVGKRCVWAPPLPLAEVKAIGKAMNASINDVLVGMASAALRRYLAGRGEEDIEGIRAIIPVNLRGARPAEELGNQFGLVFLDLPVDHEHPLERIFEVKRRMAKLKTSQQPLLAYALLQAVGLGPTGLQEQVSQMLSKSASIVLTNVPGPANTLYLAGQAITQQNFWVPQSGAIGLGLSILSYAGKVQFGIMADSGLVPDPERIAEFYIAEYERLMWLTLMSPWGEEWEQTMAMAEASV
jgi:diacylglycerol O-acyltransferase / wax synthase